MSDPYNSLGTHPMPAQTPAKPPPLPEANPGRPPLAARRQAAVAAPSRWAGFTRWLPLYNGAALLLDSIWMMATGRNPGFGGVVFFFTPLLLAILASQIGSRNFAWVVRGINLLLALMLGKRFLGYVDSNFYSHALLVLTLCYVLVPMLNALFLRPYKEE